MLQTKRPRIFIVVSIFMLLSAAAMPIAAQTDEREARAAKWEAMAMPAGEFVRHANPEKGFVLWHPPAWKAYPESNGGVFFKPKPQGVNIYIYGEAIPDGMGVASYASSVLQALRNQQARPETLVARRAMLNGLEWRELSYEVETQDGEAIRQTMWLTAIGARAWSVVWSSRAMP